MKKGQKYWEHSDGRYQLMKVDSAKTGTRSIVAGGMTKEQALRFVEGWNKAKGYGKGAISFPSKRRK
jgi:hypothetical protein